MSKLDNHCRLHTWALLHAIFEFIFQLTEDIGKNSKQLNEQFNHVHLNHIKRAWFLSKSVNFSIIAAILAFIIVRF